MAQWSRRQGLPAAGAMDHLARGESELDHSDAASSDSGDPQRSRLSVPFALKGANTPSLPLGATPITRPR